VQAKNRQKTTINDPRRLFIIGVLEKFWGKAIDSGLATARSGAVYAIVSIMYSCSVFLTSRYPQEGPEKN
jgi:hypothetical protein